MKQQKLKKAIVEAYKNGYRFSNGNIISPLGKNRVLSYNVQGYLCFSFKMDGQTNKIPVHRLSAYQKFGDIMFSADCIRHLDGNKLNNNPDNLELGSHSENRMDMAKDERIRLSVNASSYMSKYKEKDVKEIREYHDKTKSYKKTMEKFGISSKGTLFFILNQSKGLTS